MWHVVRPPLFTV